MLLNSPEVEKADVDLRKADHEVSRCETKLQSLWAHRRASSPEQYATRSEAAAKELERARKARHEAAIEFYEQVMKSQGREPWEPLGGEEDLTGLLEASLRV